jgi:acyl-coenzyme A synthetase/AMP-(fatty) acid ligase
LSPGAFSTVRVNVTVGRRLFWGGVRFDDLRRGVWRAFPPEPSRPEDLAGIFFTTGSTGPPKGVVYEHGMFDAQVRYLSSHFGYGENDVDLATFPLFAILDIVLGITSVIPDMDPTRPAKADPRKIVATLSAQGCNSLYGSPALLENLVRYGQATGATLPGLRRIITAGAPVRPALLEALHRMLPEDAVIHTPYGATEVLPVSSIDSREILEATREASEAGGGTCVGQPLAGMQVAIIGISEDPIDHWLQAVELSRREIGEIAVKGPVVTKEYFLRPEATRLAKIVDERDEGVWHRMGDVGYLDEWNRLWFCGRKTHRVEAPGRTLFTIPCEAVFNRHPRVRRSALVGIGRPGAQRPVMVIELAPGDKGRERDTLTAELLALGASCAHTKSIRTILYHPGFPVDIRHNAKIFREKLALWAEKTLAGRPAR